MSHTSVMTIVAVLSLLFGVPLALAPDAMMSLYGLKGDMAARGLGRLYGVSLVGFAAIAWAVRALPAGPAARSLCGAFAVGNGLAALVGVYIQVNGVSNALGWTTPVLYGLLAVACWGAARPDRALDDVGRPVHR